MAHSTNILFVGLRVISIKDWLFSEYHIYNITSTWMELGGPRRLPLIASVQFEIHSSKQTLLHD